MNKTVYIIFKTHLDVGYTDYAENVVKKYIDFYIPNAVKIGYELKDTDTPFVWTVGSWIIDKALREDKTGMVENAIRDGILAWHGLPFTTHSELMTPQLFEYGLNISKKLDKRFNKKTKAAKMTDVPGHTIGIVPLMAKAGIEFLHIGVNPATPVPPVPKLFKWRCDGEEVIVMYQGDYGEAEEFDDFVIYFAHTGDNLGPQTKDEVIKIYDEVKKKYFGYDVKCGTIETIREQICNFDDIPVYEKEIGDSWIHGCGTDPKKIGSYKNVLRQIKNKNINELPIGDNILLVPEHTCGMCVMLYFNDTKHYTCRQLEKADINMRRRIEKSWDEQRNYVRDAEKVLKIESEYPIKPPCTKEFLRLNKAVECPIEISWEMFDESDFDRYKKDYIRPHMRNVKWTVWDYTKVGMPCYKGKIFTAESVSVYKKENTTLHRLEFDKTVSEEFGLPYFYVEVSGKNINVQWFGKKASRLPQACWLKFKGYDEMWKLKKMGRWIDPKDAAMPLLISGIDEEIQNKDTVIKSLDAVLVAPFGRRLLQYTDKNLKRDLYFNLYNNIWNTNFPLWYSDDSMFRFEILNKE